MHLCKPDTCLGLCHTGGGWIQNYSPELDQRAVCQYNVKPQYK